MRACKRGSQRAKMRGCIGAGSYLIVSRAPHSAQWGAHRSNLDRYVWAIRCWLTAPWRARAR